MIMKLKKKSLGIGTLKFLRAVFSGTVELFLTPKSAGGDQI